MGLGNLLSLARDALNAQGTAINVVGQNITNANTPGYVRRDALLQSRIAGTVTYGGVEAVGIHRSADQFLQARTYDATSFDSAARSRDQALESVEGLFNDLAGTGLSSSVNALYSSFGALSANPSDPTARNAVLNRADQFASTVRDATAQLDTQRNDLLTQAKGVATEINGFASQVAKLNGQIAFSEASGSDAADLKDRRDQLIGQISERINVHQFTDGSGKVSLSIGGASLVEGDNANAVSIGLQGSDNSLQILVGRGAGSADVTAQVTGGKLGGLHEARDVDTVAVMQNLDKFASDVANAVNAQHVAGFDQSGNPGVNIFNVSGSPNGARLLALNPALAGRPDLVAASSSAASGPGDSGNSVLLSQLSAKALASGRTPIEAYSDLIGDLGQRKAGAEQDAELRSAVLSQAKSMRDSVSGVNMDEEMISLTRFQRAYEAAAKLVSTADELLAGLIQNL
jgi:flagellar hook-associated protein 1 FlgK